MVPGWRFAYPGYAYFAPSREIFFLCVLCVLCDYDIQIKLGRDTVDITPERSTPRQSDALRVFSQKQL
jgi:hypothetical protein